MDILLASTLTVAILHALAPDHWLPFVMLGRAQHWSPWKLTGITSLAGFGHVSSSLLIGAIGVLVGMAAEKVNLWESHRATLHRSYSSGLGWRIWSGGSRIGTKTYT